ncbi:PREDICTED: coiled-coil domain-containing protein 40 isoform X1 [Polistes dominula]|uniref:Coiled-coil domain-containing protein 40 isoform X1 n=2 Tax=Polistes dominula TaxID=743375 RepID=A0ABM1ICK3_POLDO|nr:PREDICTED: coiled-coil domain-containing protein 40 isoform X1 [Polistes dominula]
MCETEVQNLSSSLKYDSSTFNQIENSKKLSKSFWLGKASVQAPNVIDPDDALMKRFQSALKEHLLRLNNKLSEEILDLEAIVKSIKKKHEEESLQLYYAQQEIMQQENTIEEYKNTLMKLTSLREEKNQKVNDIKELHKKAKEKMQEEKDKEDKLLRDLQKMTALQNQFANWEEEMKQCLMISKKTCQKDAILQQELINEKQKKDCILFKLREEVWRLEEEITNVNEQVQLKIKEKLATSQLVADANADLEALHREHTNLSNAWNGVVLNISKRDKIYDQLTEERQKMHDSFNTLQTEIEKLKKETLKESENNENLTSLQSRVEDDLAVITKMVSTGIEKINNLESELIRITKFGEQTLNEYNFANAEYQNYLNKEEQIDKELAKLMNWKMEQENLIFEKLKEKITHDKAARYLNKLLMNTKKMIQEQELLVVQVENSYGKNLLEMARLNTSIENEKIEYQELSLRNNEKEKEINELQKEIKKSDVTIERKQMKVISLNKMIDQILESKGGEEISPQDLKILTLEKNIQETEQNNQRAQQFWLRQQGYMVTLSQQRDEQLQQLNLLNKEVTIMKQKNLKIQYQLEKFEKEDANMNKTINLLHQKLLQLNTNLVVQKELREELEDKNCIKKNEYLTSLENAEFDLIKLQRDLQVLINEKATLNEELSTAQRESLSWEKKVQIMQETSKEIKSERSSGGDIAVMKSEIHRMEMRLSHLKRAQEKLINDMEFCVGRRDVILNKVMGKLKKNPNEQQNQKIVFTKRIKEQKLKIKQILKEMKQIESNILQMEEKMKKMVKELDEKRQALKVIEDTIPDIDQEIMKMDMLKSYKLKSLVFKQRKVKLLQDIKSGRYKMLFKNEALLNDELQNERILHSYLVDVMEQTKLDFPLLKNSIHKIILTLQIL